MTRINKNRFIICMYERDSIFQHVFPSNEYIKISIGVMEMVKPLYFYFQGMKMLFHLPFSLFKLFVKKICLSQFTSDSYEPWDSLDV